MLKGSSSMAKHTVAPLIVVNMDLMGQMTPSHDITTVI